VSNDLWLALAVHYVKSIHVTPLRQYYSVSRLVVNLDLIVVRWNLQVDDTYVNIP
jgi:hypothetical protein